MKRSQYFNLLIVMVIILFTATACHSQSIEGPPPKTVTAISLLTDHYEDLDRAAEILCSNSSIFDKYRLDGEYDAVISAHELANDKTVKTIMEQADYEFVLSTLEKIGFTGSSRIEFQYQDKYQDKLNVVYFIFENASGELVYIHLKDTITEEDGEAAVNRFLNRLSPWHPICEYTGFPHWYHHEGYSYDQIQQIQHSVQ